MSTIKVREVNVVPISKIKIEIVDDEDSEDTVLCKICSKAFVSEIAVRNHARMEHITEFMNGDDLFVKPFKGNKRKMTEDQQQEIQAKTSKMMQSMKPEDITSLASEDTSYIIIKDGTSHPFTVKRVKKEKPKEKPLEKKVRKEKEVKPISGPFECLQPSNNNSEVQCHQMFLSCCEYSAHFRDEHTRRRKGNRCQVCEKPISGNESMSPYSCQICCMGFENNRELNEHTQTAHEKLKPFQCSVCQKRFTQQGGLLQHTRMHTGDRPFACTFCPKAFTQKSGLDQHLRIHTKVKPYRCVICGKSFCQSVHLQQHMRTHTNVAPFQCGICQKRFKQSSHLNYHLKYHNMIKMTDEQKAKYAQLMTQMVKQEFFEIEIDQSEASNQEIVQSEMVVTSDQSEVQEVEQSEMQTEDCNEEQENQTYYILNDGEFLEESVECE
ncbi:zinc finger protein 224 [Bicyclus anynana]|uniref:Zinc finger protein 224-like n=1 Tax=Bicyclus anynana TaxID=110368 RepID=A0A6J1NQR9_BICAN|nr:zinc finger protein 224 [Bicyclus anynana]XP_023945566.1 zinc finger protein 224 [Bicyclus anynana]